MNIDVRAIILAGGKGTRMNSELPKVMIQLSGKPLVSYTVDSVKKSVASSRPVLVVGYMNEVVMEYFNNSVDYALQDKQLGTGHAVSCALPQIKNETILVLYGDMPFITEKEIDILINAHYSASANVTMATVHLEDFSGDRKGFERYGRIIRNENGEVGEIVEYKDASDEIRLKTEVSPSYFVINTEWLRKNIPKIQANNVQKEYYLTDIIKIAIEQGERITTVDLPYRVAFGINTVEDLEIAKNVF